MKVKVIDLLIKIANGEEINSFVYNGGKFVKGYDNQYYMFDGMRFAFEDFDLLNEEIEIIENEEI